MKCLRLSCLPALAMLLWSACIIVTDSNDSDATTPAPATASPSETDATPDVELTTGAPPAGRCGWGETQEDDIAAGYVCGGEGEDPEGEFAFDCPSDVSLVEGGSCGDDGGINGIGCCDADGNVWYCAEDDSDAGPRLFVESC